MLSLDQRIAELEKDLSLAPGVHPDVGPAVRHLPLQPVAGGRRGMDRAQGNPQAGHARREERRSSRDDATLIGVVLEEHR